MMLKPFLPWWLLVVLSLAVILAGGWFLWRQRRYRERRWQIRAGTLLVGLVLLWHPVTYGGTYQSGASMSDVYFVIDVTQSMAAEDYNGQQIRLSGVRSDVKAIVSQLAGARFSVISFANTANLELPLTTDASAAVAASDALTPVMYTYAKGSSPSTPLDMLKQQLQNDQRDHPDRFRIVYYLSDGEVTGGAKVASFSPARSYITDAKVLGYGTAAGGRMKESVYQSSNTTVEESGYLHDPNEYSKDALSKLDESNLQKIAGELGGDYVHREKPGNDSILIAGMNPSRTVKSEANSQVAAYTDLSWIVALPLLCSLGWEYWYLLDERAKYQAAKGKKS